MRLHAIIISWEGYADKARAIAQALAGSVDQLTVVYSNMAETSENGAGTWIQVPQSWYFGRKFRASLDVLGPDDLMLQIQADAHSDDWAALAAGCAQCFERHNQIGLWTPDVNWSPWHADVVGEGMIPDTNLLQVRQTDGIVWALHPVLHPALRALDYTGNNLGWGIDWVALLEAQKHGRIAVRDLSYPVRHPYGRGYHNAAAAQHMKNFLTQLPLEDQRVIASLHDALDARKKAFAKAARAATDVDPSTLIPTPETTLMPWPFVRSPMAAKLSEAFVIAGQVYVKAAGPNIEAETAIECGDLQIPLTPMTSDPPRGHITHAFPLHAADTKTAYQQLNRLKEWQVDGWPTLRVIPDFSMRRQSIPLSGDMTINPPDGPQMFTANLAVHRGKGDLVICLSDTDGTLLHEMRCPFETASWGGAHSEQYKLVQVTLPPSDHPLRLSLRIDTCESPETTEDQPAVFFVARPRLRNAGERAMLTPSVTLAKKQLGNAVWYHATLDPAAQTDARDVTLVSGKKRVSLLSVPATPVTLLKDHGHMLELHTDRALSTTVWLGGAPCFAMRLEVGENTLRIPTRGTSLAPALLELRDASGTLTLWQTWHVPTVHTHPSTPQPSRNTGDLLARTSGRIAALRQHLAAPTDVALLPQLGTALSALEAGPDALTLTPLTFPDVASPDVTVILSAHPQLPVTYACLAALALMWNSARFEVIVVGNTNPDLGNLVSGITVLPAEASRTDIAAINAAAMRAAGTYITLLDAATEVTSGWLDALIAGFKQFTDVGLTGAKLLGFDGRLLSAGGVIATPHTSMFCGTGQNPDDPRYSHARQVDYLPRAALMVSKAAWDAVGGLDTDLGSASDADLAFKLRAAGYATWYVPTSVVYHDVDAASTADTAQSDLTAFAKRWADEIAQNPDPRDDRHSAGRVLFLTDTPQALDDIGLIQSAGYKVTCTAQDMAKAGADIPALQRCGVEVITAPFFTGLDDLITTRGRAFDAFYIVGCDLVNSLVPNIRARHPLSQIVMRPVDMPLSGSSEHAFDAMRSVDVVLSHSASAHALISAQDAINVMRGYNEEGASTVADILGEALRTTAPTRH